MIKKSQTYLNWVNRITDMIIISVSYYIAVWFWIFFLENDTGNIAVRFIAECRGIVFLLSLAFVTIFQYGRIYDSFRFSSLFSELISLFKLFMLCCVAVIGCIFLFKLRDFSRGVIAVFAICAYTFLSLKRISLRLMLRSLRRNGYNQKHVLIVGDGYLAEKYFDTITNNPQYGYLCLGYVSDYVNTRLGKRYGSFDNLETAIEILNPDEVVIALEWDSLGVISSVLMTCEVQGIRTSIVPMYNDYLPDCASIDVMAGMKLINLRAIALDIFFNKAMKRFVDVILSSIALILLSPLMAVVAFLVKLSGPGPVLFKQTRVGKDRKEFVMYKFRSMSQNDRSDTAWSRSRDSRVTPVGAFIRKYSIDELPQFFNVLKGEMSIVGPRPELPFFVEQFKHTVPRYMVKHQVKPGITGWAQVNGYRGDTSIDERILHDIWYIENWSILLDVKIIAMTAFGGMINKEKNLRRV